MSLFERIQKKILIEKKSDDDYFARKDVNVYKTQREYDNRPFTKYELDQAAKANTKAKTLRKRFKGSTYDGPPFARKTRKYDSVYKSSDGTKKVSPSFFDKRQEFGIRDDGKVSLRGVRQRMGSRFYSARKDQYKKALDLPDTDPNKKRLVTKYKKFLDKGAGGASGRQFLDKLVNRVTSDSKPGGGRRISKGKFERTPRIIDTSGKSLERTLKSYSDYTSPTVPSKAKALTGKKFKTFDGSPPKGLRKGSRMKLPMQGGPNQVDFDIEKLPKGDFDPKTGRGIDKGGYARVTDSKGKFIKMKSFAKNKKRQGEISKDIAKGLTRADKGGYLTAKVYSGDAKQQSAYKKAFQKGKEDFYKTTASKKILGVSNTTGDFNPQFKADKARLDFGGRIAQQAKKTTKDTSIPKSKKSYKNFAKTADKFSRYKKYRNYMKNRSFGRKLATGFKKLPFKGKAALVGAGVVGTGLVLNKIFGGKTKDEVTFKKSSVIKNKSGDDVTFKYPTYSDRKVKDNLLKKDPNLKLDPYKNYSDGSYKPSIRNASTGFLGRNKNKQRPFTDKFKSGEFKVDNVPKAAIRGGDKFDLNKNLATSAFEKQLQKAEKGSGRGYNPLGKNFLKRYQTKADKKFLKKYSNATRPT